MYFLKLHMCLYLSTKFQVFSIILSSVRHGGRGGIILPPPTHTLKNRPLKSLPRLGLSSFLALSMLQYSQITKSLKTAARSTFARNIPWKVRDFFRTKNGFKKCILSQIKLIRHWNKKANFITTCLNFKLDLTEHIRID